MVCKYCGLECEDGSLFCCHCGKSIDERKLCPACGAVVTYKESTFCNVCGARLDGKSVCSCGQTFEGAFCPACGKKSAAPVRKRSGAGASKKKVFGMIAAGLSILSALFAFAFTFCVGATLRFDETTSGLLSLAGIDVQTMLSQNYSMYYFFGEAYRDLDAIMAQAPLLTGYSPYFTASLYLPVILSTAVCVCGIISTTTLFTISVVRTVRYMTGRSERSPFGVCAGTVIAFLAFAACFASLNCGAVRVNINEKVLSVNVALNGATVTALTVGIGHLIASAVMFLLASNSHSFNAKSVFSLAVKGVKTALIIGAVILATYGVATVSTSTTATYVVVTKSFSGPVAALTLLSPSLAIAANSIELSAYGPLVAETVINVAVIAALCVALVFTVRSIAQPQDKLLPSVISDAAALTVSLASAIVTSIGVDAFNSYLSSLASTTDFSEASFICTVLSVICIGIACIGSIALFSSNGMFPDKNRD